MAGKWLEVEDFEEYKFDDYGNTALCQDTEFIKPIIILSKWVEDDELYECPKEEDILMLVINDGYYTMNFGPFKMCK